jgi:hypothetical protein
LLASEKLLTELTTLLALSPIAAIWEADGLDGSALTALESESTDDFTALVSLGKSLLAELTTVVAWLWIVVTWDGSELIPLLETELGRLLTEFCRLVRSEQYAGLLLPQPASAMSAAATNATGTRIHARPTPLLALSGLVLFNSV